MTVLIKHFITVAIGRCTHDEFIFRKPLFKPEFNDVINIGGGVRIQIMVIKRAGMGEIIIPWAI